jgi:hypothetical protein
LLEKIGTFNQEGKLFFQNPYLHIVCAYLAGKRVEIKIREKKKRDSPPQRGYYFGVVCELAAECINKLPEEHRSGLIFTAKDMHEQFTTMFLKNLDIVSEHGMKLFEANRRFHQLNIGERSDFIQECTVWIETNFDIIVPKPNEQIRL